MTTDAKVQRRLLKRAWGSSRPSLFLSGMSENGMDRPCSRQTREHTRGGQSGGGTRPCHASLTPQSSPLVSIPARTYCTWLASTPEERSCRVRRWPAPKLCLWLANVPPCLIGIEAGMGTHYV